MLDIKFIRENPEKIKEGCEKKGVKVEIERLLEKDKKRRQLIQAMESLRAEQNKLSQQQIDRERAKEIKEKIKKLEPELDRLEKEFKNLMLQIPNLPLAEVPVGQDEKENIVLREVGKKPQFDFPPKDYLFLAEKSDLIDIERAAKVSGSRFGYFKREAVLLEFALVQLALEFLTKEGFIPVVPPVMLKPKAMRAMGYLDQAPEEIYFLEKDKLYLVGTAEQSIGPMHMDEIFQEKDLPRRYVGFSTCFRREAGSYGKDTKGILRVHQFDKVEMFSFCQPEDSQKEHEYLLSLEEKFVQALKIPYRVMKVCTGDLGFPSAKTYDLECWMPGQGEYRETHSTSNCTDFQARRLNIRYRPDQGSPRAALLREGCPRAALVPVHTLNATAFAIGRMIIAILENYQQKDCSIKVPKVLRKYLGKKML